MKQVNEKKLYSDRLFDKFLENWDERQEITAFSTYLKDPSWMIVSDVPTDLTLFKKTQLSLSLKNVTSSYKDYRKKADKFIRFMRTSKSNMKTEKLQYCGNCHAICYPLKTGNDNFGFIVLFDLKKAMSKDTLNIFCSFIDAAIRESRKELDLEEINITIKARAIALSTVHTLHRLITSTLELNELLPRIARLSLQVIHANRCSIKLVDKKRKALLPKVTIDLRKEKTQLKKIQIGRYAPGKAVQKQTPVRGTKYLATPMIDEDVVGVITLYDRLDGRGFTYLDEEIMKTLAEQSAIAIKNAQLFKEQADLTFSSIRCIAQLLANRSNVSSRAQASFLKLIYIIGRKLKLNESEIKMLQYAAMLHDAGQISIPEKVLMKRGELTGKEYDIVKKHPLKGADILKKFKPLKPIIPIILYHHESFDGTGYPKGLKGENIPVSARILAVVSSFEAMITDKPYRKAYLIKKAVNEVRKSAGSQFDPHIVEVFCDAVKRKNVRKLLEKEIGIK